jgi:hypothetical protein
MNAGGRAAGKPGGGDSDGDERDTRMTGVYIAVVVVEALVIAALWAFGRLYS